MITLEAKKMDYDYLPKQQLIIVDFKTLFELPISDVEFSRDKIPVAVNVRKLSRIFDADHEMVESTLGAGGDPNYKNKAGNTALLNCILENYADSKEIVGKLVKRQDIDVNYQNKKSKHWWTALHAACAIYAKNNEAIVRLLLSCESIDVNLLTKDGLTALHLAAENGSLQIVKALIEHGEIDPNVRATRDKLTAAMMAHRSNSDNNSEIIKEIIKYEKSNYKVKNANGQTIALMTDDKTVLRCIVNRV